MNKQIKVRVKRDEVVFALGITNDDPITLEGEVVEELPSTGYPVQTLASSTLRPTKEGECCSKCVLKDGYIGRVGYSGTIGCNQTDCPCHKRECCADHKDQIHSCNCPCHRPE